MAMLAVIEDVEAVTSRTVGTDDTANVLRLIEFASARVLLRIGKGMTVFDEATDTVTIQPHDGVIRLPGLNITAVSSVTVGSTLIDPQFYTFESNGYLRRLIPANGVPDGQFWLAGDYDRHGLQWPIDGQFGWPPISTAVTYTHGYATGSPDDISLVVAELAASKWLSGENNATNLVGVSIDSYSEHYQKTITTEAWSPEHAEIIDSYRRSKFAALRLG